MTHMFPHDIVRSLGEVRASLLESVRMCPRCLEDGKVAWVRTHNPSSRSSGVGDPEEQFCFRCNSTWGFNQCVELAAWMEGLMSSLAIIDYDGSDVGTPARVQKIMEAQERREQEREIAEPKKRYDTKDGW